MIAIKAAESAQEESRLLNRPITILAATFQGTCLTGCAVGYSVGFQRGFAVMMWLRCKFPVES